MFVTRKTMERELVKMEREIRNEVAERLGWMESRMRILESGLASKAESKILLGYRVDDSLGVSCDSIPVHDAIMKLAEHLGVAIRIVPAGVVLEKVKKA